MRCGAATLAAVLLVALAGTPPSALGGEASGADAACRKGAKALRARKWDDAVRAYREALLADPGLSRAQAGLGEALLGAGRKGEGLELMRVFVERVEADPIAAARLEDRLEDVRKLLHRKDRQGRRLSKRIDDYVASCLRRAAKWTDDAPDGARLAWKEAATLRPDEPALAALAAKLDLLAPGVALFNGMNAKGWAWLQAPEWRVSRGQIVGRGTDVWSVCRTARRLEGDFDLRSEIQVLDGGKSVAFLVQGAWTSYESNISLGMVGERVLFIEGRELPGTADPPSGKGCKTRVRVDPEAWNLFELRFRKDSVEAFVNGESVGTIPRRPAYAEGHAALVAVLGEVAFRKIEVRHH